MCQTDKMNEDVRTVASGRILIDKLNEEVERKTCKAVQESKASGKPLGVAYEAVLKPMSVDGIWAGSPVYVRRSLVPTILVGSLGALMMALSAPQCGLFPSMVCALVMFLWFDLYSGMLHVVLDEPLNISSPIIGQPALEFQWHHFIPTDIVRKDFSDVVGDLNVPVIAMGVIHCFYSTALLSEPIPMLLASLKLFWAWYGQASHRFAHNPKISQIPIAKFLQQVGLMVAVKDHKAHHQPPHEEDYCLIGIMNPMIDAMRTVSTNRFVWLGVFLSASIFDVVLLTAVVRKVCIMAGNPVA